MLEFGKQWSEEQDCLAFSLVTLYLSVNHSVLSDSLRTHGLQPARLLCPWGFSRQEYWNGLPCHALLQGIFPTQRLNPGLPHCRQILYRLSHQGGPTAHLKIILTWRPGASLQEVIKCCFHYISLCNISNVTNLFSRVRVFSFFIQRP